MKKNFIIFSLLTVLFSGSVFAKEVTVPFIQKAVPSEGLLIKYDMGTIHGQKVVCIFDHFYKGSVKYTQNNIEKEGLPFGNGDDAQQYYFTAFWPAWESPQGLDNLNQFHADVKGFIKVISFWQKAYATCFYLPEDFQNN